MVTVLKTGVTDEQIENLCRWFRARGLDVHISKGKYQTIIGLIGDTKQIDTELLESLDIVGINVTFFIFHETRIFSIVFDATSQTKNYIVTII